MPSFRILEKVRELRQTQDKTQALWTELVLRQKVCPSCGNDLTIKDEPNTRLKTFGCKKCQYSFTHSV